MGLERFICGFRECQFVGLEMSLSGSRDFCHFLGVDMSFYGSGDVILWLLIIILWV